VTNGFYAVTQVVIPYTQGESVSKQVKQWARAYQERFGAKPDVYAAYGYMNVMTFARAARKAGENLTEDGLVKGIKQLDPTSNLLQASFDYSTKRHSGGTVVHLFQLKEGRWQPVAMDLKVNRVVPKGSKYAVSESTQDGNTQN